MKQFMLKETRETLVRYLRNTKILQKDSLRFSSGADVESVEKLINSGMDKGDIAILSQNNVLTYNDKHLFPIENPASAFFKRVIPAKEIDGNLS